MSHRTIALTRDHITFLEYVCAMYNCRDVSEALRRAVVYVQHSDAATQRLVFTKIRCRRCGIKFPKIATSVHLPDTAWSYLAASTETYRVQDPDENGKILRIILDFTQEGSCKRGMTHVERRKVLDQLEKDMFVL